ncbi:MAG: TlpA family protein disulfide reductase [Thiohalobacterales bacterium]
MKALLYIPLLYIVLAAQAAGLPPGVMVMDGRPAPALVLENIDGEPWDISKQRGHWLFVHFWATWCGPCRREMPTIQKLAETLQDDRLEIVMVNTAETEDEVFSFLGIVAPDLIPLMDTDGLVTEIWQPRGLPATFLVDPEGKIRYLALGGRDWNTPPYRDFLRRIIAH